MMKAAVLNEKKSLLIQDLALPELPEGGALVRVTACGVCGSDLDKLLYRPTQPGTVLGHEVVGTIFGLSEEAQACFPQFSVGQRVAVAHHVPCQQCHYCMHGSPSMCRTFKATNITPGGFAEYIAVSAQHLAHTVFPLPPSVSDFAGTCIEPLACCLRAVNRIPKGTGNTALVVGLGFVGLLTAHALELEGYISHGIDLKPERVALAQAYGRVSHATQVAADVLATLTDQTSGRGADVVFLTVVNPNTMALALQAVRDGGALVLFTAYPQGQVLLNQNELYFREITVITSYSPSLFHLQKAADLILSQTVSVDYLLTEAVALEALEDGIARYQAGDALKVMVTL